jgi:hypothetical protein
MGAAAKFHAVLVGVLVALAFALLMPSIDHAAAETNNGGGGKVTCSGGGGLPDGEPGDVNTVNTYTYVNGKYVAKTTVRMICGNDGRWHTIAAVTRPPRGSFPAVSVSGRTLGG